MFLDLFDDVFLLDFALKSLQRTFQGLTILDDYFGQLQITSLILGKRWIVPQMELKFTAETQ